MIGNNWLFVNPDFATSMASLGKFLIFLDIDNFWQNFCPFLNMALLPVLLNEGSFISLTQREKVQHFGLGLEFSSNGLQFDLCKF